MRGELLNFLRDRRLWRGPLPAVMGLLLAANFGAAWLHDLTLAERRRNLLVAADYDSDAALAKNTPRFDWSVGENLGRFIKYMPDASKQKVWVLSGMSQMYAINDRKPNDKTISEWMDDAFATNGTRVFGLAGPNLCNEEAFFILQLLLTNSQTRPSVFLYGVCFDKFRNLDLRPGYEKILRDSATLQQRLRDVALDYKERYPRVAAKILTALDGTSHTEYKDTFEARLRARTSEFVPLVRERNELNGLIFNSLYIVRNTLLNIKTTTKRPMLKSRYDLNCEFLRALADEARKNNVEPIFYINPLNPSADNPYVTDEYLAFKKWLEAFCTTEHIAFANLENAIPPEEWGELLGGPDFKHFTGAAHKRLAHELVQKFDSLAPRKPAGELTTP